MTQQSAENLEALAHALGGQPDADEDEVTLSFAAYLWACYTRAATTRSAQRTFNGFDWRDWPEEPTS